MEEGHLKLSKDIAIPHYKLVLGKLLGEGSFGKVYSGTWKRTSLDVRPVAIKRLKMAGFSWKLLEDFSAEVKVHATLESDYIVKLYGVTIKQPYSLVMEYMHNKSLDIYLNARKPKEITWSVRIRLANDIAAGLNYLHTQKPHIVHADLKSMNIMLDKNYRAKLGDFGLAKMKKIINSRSTFVSASRAKQQGPGGSLLWMAPELFEKDGKNSRSSDIYAFGMVMWELAAHKLPFPNVVNPQMLIYKIMQSQLDAWPADTPKSYQTIGDLSRQKDPMGRPSMAVALSKLGMHRGNSPTDNNYNNNNLDYARGGKPNPCGRFFGWLSSSINTYVQWGVEGLLYHTILGDLVSVEKTPEANRAQIAKLLLAQKLGRRIDQQAQQMKDHLDTIKLKNLLYHTMRGDLKEVEKLLKTNKSLVYGHGDITDLSERKFSKITAFQYAMWALDKPMWELILKYLPEDQAGIQLKALEEDREDIIKAHGAHFSFDLILERLQHYVDHYDGWNYDQRDAYWCKKVGGAQRAFPAWLIMTMCEKGKEVAWVKQDATMAVKRDLKHLTWWASEKHGGLLGSAWGAVRAETASCVGLYYMPRGDAYGRPGYFVPAIMVSCLNAFRLYNHVRELKVQLLLRSDAFLSSLQKGQRN